MTEVAPNAAWLAKRLVEHKRVGNEVRITRHFAADIADALDSVAAKDARIDVLEEALRHYADGLDRNTDDGLVARKALGR